MPPQSDVGDSYPLQADNRRNVFITVDKIGFKNSKLIESFVDPIITIYIVCEGVALLILCRSSRTRARSHPPPFFFSLSLEAPFPFVPHHHAVDVEASRIKSRETLQPLCSYLYLIRSLETNSRVSLSGSNLIQSVSESHPLSV